MKMNKNNMLGALKAMKIANGSKIDNGPSNTPIYSKQEVLQKLGNFTPKADGKGKFMDDSRKKLNTDLSVKQKATVESEWTPAKSDIKSISNKLVHQTRLLENSNPNAFRLNLRSLVLYKTHAKLSLRRGSEVAKIDLLYPNANGKITVKISIDGVEDVIYEVALEDEDYVTDFGASILEKIDEMVHEKEGHSYTDYNAGGMYAGSNNTGVTDMAPNWVSGNSTLGTIADSDMRKMNDLLSLMEADDEENTDDTVPADDLGGMEGADASADSGADVGADATAAGDVNAGGDFGAEDFSLDAGGGADLGGGMDFGGGDMGGDMGGAGDVNADDQGKIGTEDDTTFIKFRDKTDWLNSSLDSMQKLVAKNVADQMQKGEGVILTQDEILNGSVGIKNDSNADIIEKFLKVYPSLDEIELKEDDLNRIEEKLSLDDGQFDSWLQNELPNMRGDSDVTDVLNNDMFNNTFEPMGGEKTSGSSEGLGDFDDFMNATEDFAAPEDDVQSTLEIEAEAAPNEEEEASLEQEAERDVNKSELNEFPNT
jgi:hypothetical protein